MQIMTTGEELLERIAKLDQVKLDFEQAKTHAKTVTVRNFAEGKVHFTNGMISAYKEMLYLHENQRLINHRTR